MIKKTGSSSRLAVQVERRNPPCPVPVQDRPGEVGIKLNNILTAMILGVISWVGYSINDMRATLSEAITVQAVNTVKIDSNTTRIKSLESTVFKHD